MKKVVIIFPKDSEAFFNNQSEATFGGASTQLYLIAKELNNYNSIKTYSFINHYGKIDFDDKDKFNLVRTFKSKDSLIKKVFIFHKKIRQIKPDFIVQRGLTLISCLLALYCKFFKIKFIFMFAHDRESMGRYQKTNKRNLLFFFLLRFSELLITQSDFQKQYLPKMYQSKIRVIKSGYEINKINKKKKKYVLWVGRLEPWKEPEKFIELAKNFPQMEFVMVAPTLEGYEEYGKVVQKETEYIQNLTYIPFVKFNEIDYYFNEAKLFINTSKEEGFPNTFIQSCKNKTPIISLNVNPDNFLETYNCGYFCYNDFNLMQKYVKELIEDNSLFESKSESAYKYAIDVHDIKNNVKKLVDYVNYRQIIIIFPKDSEALFNKESKRTFGGANIQMYFIAKELGEKDNVNTFSFIPNYNTIKFNDEDKFHLIKTFNEKDNILKKVWTFHKKIIEVKPDIVVQRGLTLISCFLALYCRIINIKFVFMFAHDIESLGRYQSTRKKAFFFSVLLKFSHLLVVQNEYEYNNINEKTNGKAVILKKGLDLEKILSSKKKQYDCIWIARCEPWKRPELFIELAVKNPKAKFLMVCSKVEKSEAYFYKIKNMCSEVDNIEFYDFVDNNEIYAILSKSKLFCITSEMEGDWPMTVLESAATGLPILSYNLNYGGLFSEYDAGYLCDSDPDLLDSYFNKLINSKRIYEKKSKGAFKYIVENHNIKKNVDTMLSFL